MSITEKFERYIGSDVASRNLKEKSVRGALFMAIWNGIDFVLRIVATVILARLLVPEFFGLVAMVTAVTGIAEGIKDLGLPTATIQRTEISHAQLSNLFWINVTAGALFFLFFCGISVALSKFYREPRLIAVTIAFSTSFFWSGLADQHKALLSRQLKQGHLALIRLSANIISTIAAILLAIGEYGYWALVWREVIQQILVSVGTWLCCPWIPGRPCRHTGIRELLSFGRDLSVTNLIVSMVSKIDGLLIGKFFGAIPLGMYRQAYQLMMVPIDQLNEPIFSVAQPGLSKLQSNKDLYKLYYQKLLFFVSLTTIPLGLFVFIYAKEIVLLVLGEKWTGSTDFLRIFAIAAAFRPAIGTSAIVLITCGQSTRYLLVALGHSVILCIFLVIGIQWGAVGVAIGHVSTSAVLMIPKLYYSFAKTPITVRHFFKTISSTCIASTVMTAILYILSSLIRVKETSQFLILAGFVGVTIYLTVLFLIPNGRKEVISLYKDAKLSLRRKTLSSAEKRLSIT